MKISKASFKDLNQCWQLRLEATKYLRSLGVDQWQHEDPTIEDFKHDIAHERLYVLKDKSELIGMFALLRDVEPTYKDIKGSWNQSDPYYTIHRLALNPLFQGKGHAKKMLDYAEKIAVKEHCYYLRIDTHPNNLKAQALFKNQGYQYCGTIMLTIKHGDQLRYAYDKRLKR